jgi:hypothetical protein
MGVGTELVENFLQGATWGLSNFIGLTGREGVIHNADDDPANQSVIVDDDGIYFIEDEIQIGWEDVVDIKTLKITDEFIYIVLRGGLIVSVSGDMDECNDRAACTDVDLADLDAEDTSAANCKAIRTGIDNLLWAIDMADKLRFSSGVTVNEVDLLRKIVLGYIKAWQCSLENFNEKTKSYPPKVKPILAGLEEIKSRIKDQVGNLGELLKEQEEVCDEDDDEDEEGESVDEDDRESECDVEKVNKETAKVIGGAFFWSRGWPDSQTGEGIARQKEVYDVVRSARAWGYEVGESAKAILCSDENADTPFGADKWSNYRKMIVCTDRRPLLSTIENGIDIPNTMVMDARDIIDYNDSVEDGLKLKFELNHPQNGVSYVQHPTLRNTYISIESYHLTLLERKYEELKHVLTCLGATSLELTAESSSSIDEKSSVRQKFSAAGSTDVYGDASVEGATSKHDARMRSLNKTLSTKRILVPRGKPYIPDDVEFYPTEQGWQRLAKLALAGEIKSEEVSLTYRNESAISGNALKSISTKLRSVIPGFSFSAEGNFESEYENELKSLESLSRNYKVGFGESRDEEETSDRSPKEETETVEMSNKKQNADGGNANRVEALILRRARQFAKADGIDLTDNHRQQLIDMGAKYGVDELRIEELIADACDEA